MCVCVCVFSSQFKKNHKSRSPLKCFQTDFLFVFMWCCQCKERSVLHYCSIREDFGLLGVDIWLKPCQSIAWFSGIDRCAERPTCLFVFQSTGLCMYIRCLGQPRNTTDKANNDFCFYIVACFCVLLIQSLSFSRYSSLISWFLYLFFWTWCNFDGSSATFFIPVCDSLWVTHC